MRLALTQLLLLVAVSLTAQSDLALANPVASTSAFNRLFGRLPTAQVMDEIILGGTIRNYGPGAQTSVMLNIDVQGPMAFSTMLSVPAIQPNDSAVVLSAEPIPMLAQGTYMVTYSVTSDQTPSDPNLANNESVRHISVNDSLCSLDGIGVVPANEQVLGNLGTWSFAGVEDGLTLLSFFNLKSATTVSGFEALLAPGSQPGGFVVFAIADTADILGNFIVNPIVASDAIDVTPDMVADGLISGTPTEPTVLPPGGYYITITLFSSAGAYPIGIQDDLTYARGPLESLIYIPADAMYADGNALAVRMRTGGTPSCHAEYLVTQALDGVGAPIPFVLNLLNTSSADTPEAQWTWLWDFGDGTTSSAQYPSHTYASNGPYEICLTLYDGLVCTSTFCDSISVDADGMFSRNGFTVNVVPELTLDMPSNEALMPQASPNPTEGLLSIGPLEIGLQAHIAVFDASGRQVMAAQHLPGADRRVSIDLHSLKPGAYSVRMTQGGQFTTRLVMRY